MGALPSRETQERGLYSHRHGRNRRNEIILIPLTSTFFPSAECELFQHLFKARYRRTTKYYFRALRSTECSTESDYFCTTSAVNEPELFAQYVQERENKLAQAKADCNVTKNNDSSNTKSKVSCNTHHTNAKCTQDEATDVDYHYHSFADTPEGLYQVLIRDNDLCVYNTDEELREAYLHQTREQRTELERMTRHGHRNYPNDNINGVNGHLCNNFVQQSKKEEETDCDVYGKQDDSNFAHSNEHNTLQFWESCIENVTFDAFMTGYMAAQRYHKGKVRHTHYAKQQQKEQQQLENNKEAINARSHVSEKYNECNNNENDKINKVDEQNAATNNYGDFAQKCNYCNNNSNAHGVEHLSKQQLQQEEEHYQEEYIGVSKTEKKAEDTAMDVHANNTVNHESKYDVNTTTSDTVLMCKESNDKSTTLCVNTEARSNDIHTINNKVANNNIACESDTLRSPIQQSVHYQEEQQQHKQKNQECSHHEYSGNDSNNYKSKVYKKEVLKRVTSPNAYNIRPIPCAIASRYDATKPPPTDDPLYVQFDGFYVKIMGMFGLFPSTMGCRYQTCTTDEYKCSGDTASADIQSNKNYNDYCNGVNNINKNDARVENATQMNTKSCFVQNHQHHRQRLPRKEGNANCGDIDSDSDDDEDNNTLEEEEHYVPQHVLKGTMFIDKDVGDQILGNMVMLATHMYVRQCLEAHIKPEYIPMMPVVLRSPMSNIPMLQFLREFRVRLRTLMEAGTARSGELPYYVGMSGFHPADIALPHDPCKQKEELIRYLFEEDVPDISDYDDLFDARLSNVSTNTINKPNESAAPTIPSIIMNSNNINNNNASTITTNYYNNGTNVNVNGDNNNSAQNANVQTSASDQTTSPMYMTNHFLAVHNLSNNFTPLPVNNATQNNSFLSTLHSPTWPAQISPPTSSASSTTTQNVTKGVAMMVSSLFP